MRLDARECTAREFLALSERRRPFARESAFTPDRQACDPAKNALLRRRHALVGAFAGEEIAARLLLLDGGETAWFSLPVLGEAEAARALLCKAEEIAARWGAREICGPVSPDGSGFGLGAALPGSAAQAQPWHPGRNDALVQALLREGFLPTTRLLEMAIPIAGRENPYRGAGEWAARRKGLRVCVLPMDRRACEAAFAASEDAHALGYAAFERVFARCAALERRCRAIVAFEKEQPAGWILFAPAQAQDGRAVRLLHMQILPRYRRGACAAALLEAAWEEAAARRAGRIFVSTIDSANRASFSLSRNAGGEIVSEYALFGREILTKGSN
ncbi:MAG: GNAT family N-acetyltransferase [Eubacteriales bacterium]|nr:GNAT family N-acetyltransferase [Eubacteriales bacterium]